MPGAGMGAGATGAACLEAVSNIELDSASK